MPIPTIYTLSAQSGGYVFEGLPIVLAVGWGGDAAFEWEVPEVDASVLAAAQVDGSVNAPKTVFRWE